MLFLHTFHPSPLLASIGPFVVRWYGLTLAFGALCGFLTLRFFAKRRGWSGDAALTIFFSVLVMGFIGGRIYHVLNEPTYYAEHPAEIVQVWHGGLAIHGGLLFGAATLWWFARRWRIPLLHLTDLVAPAIAIGQSIGRWGNYFNQELFGRPTSLPWGIPIDPANRPPGFETAEFFHPTFLYESLWELGVFLLLFFLLMRATMKRGIATFVYLGLAAFGRLTTESLRIDATPMFFGIRLPLIVSALLIVVAIIGLWYCSKRSNGHQTPQGST